MGKSIEETALNAHAQIEEAQRVRIIADGMGKFADNVAFYTKDKVFYLPPERRWVKEFKRVNKIKIYLFTNSSQLI